MLVYVIILMIPLCWYLLPDQSKNTNNFLLAFSLFTLLVISSLRDGQMGTDYHGYLNYFESISRTGDAFFNEKGYVWFNYLLSRISTDNVVLALGVNLLLFIPLYCHIRNNTEDKYWALCVLIFVANPYMYVQTTFNILRQCCATGFVLIAANFFKKKRLTSSIIGMLFIVAAMQFHRSVVLVFLFFLPFLFPLKWSAARWRLVFFVCLGINLSGGVEFICQALASEFSYGGYANYEASLLDNPAYLLLCLIFFWWMTRIYDRLDDSTKGDFFVNIFMLCMCVLPLAVKNDMIYRLRIYLTYVSLPGLVKIICAADQLDFWDSEKEDRGIKYSAGNLLKKMYVAYFVCFFIAYFTYFYLRNNIHYVPFKFTEFY